MSLKKTFLLVLTLVPQLVLADVESDDDATEVFNQEIVENTVDSVPEETLVDATTGMPVDINQAVQARLNNLVGTSDQKRRVKAILSRISLFEDALIKYASLYKVPTELIAIAVIESALQPKAKSKQGHHAAGLWQFVPGTARRFGLAVRGGRDDRLDPVKSTEAAMKYLSYLYDMFGDWRLVIKAYNIGEGALRGMIRRMGTKDPWVLERRQKRRAGYLTRVMAVVVLLKHPEMLE